MGRPAVFLLLAYGTLHAYAFAFPAITQLGDLLRFEQVRLQDQPLSQGSLENWIANEEEIALEKLLANISPGGSNVGSEAANGTVIASPSREHPNYYYQCTSDPIVHEFSKIEWISSKHKADFHYYRDPRRGNHHFHPRLGLHS